MNCPRPPQPPQRRKRALHKGGCAEHGASVRGRRLPLAHGQKPRHASGVPLGGSASQERRRAGV